MPKMQKLGDGMYVWGDVRKPEEYANLASELTALQSVDLANVSDHELRQRLQTFGRGYVTRTMWSMPKTSFRASRPTDPEDPWNHIRELWAPPAKFTTRGRFNEPKKPVLYFSGEPFTALAEVRARAREYRVLLVLRKVNTKSALRFMQVGLEKMNAFDTMIDTMGNTLGGLQAEPVLNEYLQVGGILPHWKTQDRFFSDIATDFYDSGEAELRYRLSFMLAHQLQSVKGISGLLYPSAVAHTAGINIAVPVNEARTHFIPLEAWLVSLGTEPRLYAWTPTDPREPAVIRRGNFDGAGNIHWGEFGHWPTHALHKEVAPRNYGP